MCLHVGGCSRAENLQRKAVQITTVEETGENVLNSEQVDC